VVREGSEWAAHGEQEAAAAVVVGNRAPAKIGGRLGAGEHEQSSGKLGTGSVRAMGARWWLSTVTRGSPERRSRQRR
jgi:hypothetical protein